MGVMASAQVKKMILRDMATTKEDSLNDYDLSDILEEIRRDSEALATESKATAILMGVHEEDFDERVAIRTDAGYSESKASKLAMLDLVRPIIIANKAQFRRIQQELSGPSV